MGLALGAGDRACSPRRSCCCRLGRAEPRSSEPLVDMKMMRVRGVWTINLAAALIGFGMYSSFMLIPQFVEPPTSTGYGFGATVTQAGLFLLPSTARC